MLTQTWDVSRELWQLTPVNGREGVGRLPLAVQGDGLVPLLLPKLDQRLVGRDGVTCAD